MRIPVVAAVALCLLVLAGCRDESKPVPSACRQGAETVRKALADAPGKVRLDGTTPISACIKDTSTGGEMSDVGSAYISVAQDLADDASTDPDGPSALQLGYLIGAVQRSRKGSQGVGYELERRLALETSRVDERAPEYVEGLRAGRGSG